VTSAYTPDVIKLDYVTVYTIVLRLAGSKHHAKYGMQDTLMSPRRRAVKGRAGGLVSPVQSGATCFRRKPNAQSI